MFRYARLGVSAGTALLVCSGVGAQTTYRACRVPQVGVIYMIGVGDAPTGCVEPTHVEFSWTEGGATTIAPGSIGSTELADGGVGTADLADGAVVAAKLSPSAVTSAAVLDGSLALVDFAPAVRLPIAWGAVAEDGTLLSASSSVISVTPWNPVSQSYYIELDFSYDPSAHLVLVTVVGFSNVGRSAIVSDDIPGQVAVHISDAALDLVPASFYFVVY